MDYLMINDDLVQPVSLSTQPFEKQFVLSRLGLEIAKIAYGLVL